MVPFSGVQKNIVMKKYYQPRKWIFRMTMAAIAVLETQECRKVLV